MRNQIIRKGLPILLGLSVLAISPVAAQDNSTPEERTQWVQVTHDLESHPLDDALNRQGETAVKRLIAVHDIHVPLCGALFTEFSGMKYDYGHNIMRQFLRASAVFIIQNPDRSSDTRTMSLAALESLLKSYQAILQEKPAAKNKVLDDLLKKQSEGRLEEVVDKRCR